MTAAAWMAIARWVHVAAAMVLFGAAFYPAYAPTGRFLDRPLRMVVRASAALALLTAVAWILALMSALFDDGDTAAFAWANVVTFFLDTSFGSVWIVRLTLLIFVGLVCLSLRRNSWTVRVQARVLAVAAGMMLASDAFLGHAAAIPGAATRGTALAVQALHLVAGGAWLGGTVPLFIVVRAELRTGNTAGVCRALRRFSTMGMVFVALVLATGIVNGALRITRAAELTGTEYGRTLLFKAGLVLALVVLALINRCALLPRLARMGRGGGTILGAIGLEWIVGLCVLAVAVMLGGTPPPL